MAQLNIDMPIPIYVSLQTSLYDTNTNTNQPDSCLLAMVYPLRLGTIKSNPIGEGLTAFRDASQSTCEDLGISTSIDIVHQEGNGVLRDLVVNLIFALQSLPAAGLLPSTARSGSLRSDLFSLGSWAVSDDFNFDRIAPLWNAVFNNESDEKVWKEVSIAVVDSTPPPRVLPCLDQTPHTYNTSSIVDTAEYRKQVDNVLKVELGANFYIGVPRFHEVFFGEIAGLETTATAVFKKCQEGIDSLYSEELGWHGWPRGAEEKHVLKWFAELIDFFLDAAKEVASVPNIRRRLIAQPNQHLQGSTANRKLDIGFMSDLKANQDPRCHWSQILVPGELKSNPDVDTHSKTWLDLARYVREVFTSQDTRRFVLGFTLCGSIMRLWEFDRLGAIASIPFDINKDGLKLVSTTLGYLWMTEEQLGFDPTIVEMDGKRYIDIVRKGQKERLVLRERMKRAPCVAGRATTCWKAYRDGDELQRTLVVKDSWQYPEREEEGELLHEAMKKGVVNVARYYHHETVHVADEDDGVYYNVRKGLDITKATNYDVRQSISFPNTSGQNSGTREVQSANEVGEKRSSTNTPLPPSKRICSSSLIKDGGNSAGWDRIHRRVIISDYGKPIYKASSLFSMLSALEDCIDGYESLYTQTGLIQSDISIGNLLMNEDEDNPSWRGFVIDLDLAIREKRESPLGARGKTGTRAFMAIGVLYGEKHSFMHDLESFFWVLFWICIHYNKPGGGKKSSEFEDWNYNNTTRTATLKSGVIVNEQDFLRTADECFMSYYKPLIPYVNRLRKVVFPGGSRWMKEDKKLYSRMKEVLQEAREDLKNS